MIFTVYYLLKSNYKDINEIISKYVEINLIYKYNILLKINTIYLITFKYFTVKINNICSILLRNTVWSFKCNFFSSINILQVLTIKKIVKISRKLQNF